jgi:hypothetical protein
VAVLDGVVVEVIEVLIEVVLVADEMFPEAALPYAAIVAV